VVSVYPYSSSFSVSVVQLFTDEMRVVTAALRTNIAAMGKLQGKIEDCGSSVDEALQDLLQDGAFNLTEARIIPEEDWMGGWSNTIVFGLLVSILCQVMLMSYHLGVPRTAVSTFLNYKV
jgi:hypothetical protein